MSNDVETKGSAPRGKSGHHLPKPRPPASELKPGEAEEAAKSSSRRPSFAALLVEAGVASQEDVKAASAEGLVTGEKLGEVVVRKGWATEEAVAEVLAKQWELPYANADELIVDEQAASLIPIETARDLQVLPVGFEGTAVVFAVAEPTTARFKEVEQRYGEASYVVVARSALLAVLDDSPRVTEEPETPEAAAEVPAGPAVAVDAASASEPAAPAPAAVPRDADPLVEAVLTTIDGAASELTRVRGEIIALGSSLALARKQLSEQEDELEQAAEDRERDAEAIRTLEAKVDEQAEVLASLGEQVASWNARLNTAATS